MKQKQTFQEAIDKIRKQQNLKTKQLLDRLNKTMQISRKILKRLP